MARDLIRYDLLTQDALRGVVRRVLTDAARDGLPGDHHFFISFNTRHPGVRISQRLRATYPEEMTVVLQHQFWDLGVTEHAFEVGLSFGNVPERLLVPFEAITGFFDPSVQFGVKFEPMDEEGSEDEAGAELKGETRAGPRGAASEPQELPARAPAPVDEKAPAAVPAAQSATEAGSAEVVRLDTFRKKT